MANYLDVDLDAVTKRLKSSGSWTNAETTTGAEAEFHWMGHPLDEDVRTEGLDTYHGDFRKRSNCGCEEH
ncbi:hypothetical protein PHISCL_11129 [Aspergillus sclerotialis]|uniref:Uncharacterized protein n=1 Tax=Aspergillus sclerotialis TaxID=2070753 RepID=A0A3A2ZAS4_9EURO|nr:hypothetical protein PHISCL_11129 [Aspergillus sclerotialis]